MTPTVRHIGAATGTALFRGHATSRRSPADVDTIGSRPASLGRSWFSRYSSTSALPSSPSAWRVSPQEALHERRARQEAPLFILERPQITWPGSSSSASISDTSIRSRIRASRKVAPISGISARQASESRHVFSVSFRGACARRLDRTCPVQLRALHARLGRTVHAPSGTAPHAALSSHYRGSVGSPRGSRSRSRPARRTRSARPAPAADRPR